MDLWLVNCIIVQMNSKGLGKFFRPMSDSEDLFPKIRWEKLTPKSGKITRRWCLSARGSARKVHEGVSRGSREMSEGSTMVLLKAG